MNSAQLSPSRDRFFQNPLNVSNLIFAGVVALLVIAPFGWEATQPLVFLAFRTLLVGVTTICFWSLRRESTPDFQKSIYLMGIGILSLMGVSVWASPGSDPNGWTTWYEHLLFALFFVAFARFSATRSSQWKGTLLSVLIAVAMGHLLLYSTLDATGPGLFPNKNYFAAYLLVPFGAAVSITLFHERLKWRVLAGTGALGLLYGITSSVSRGATLAAFCVIALALILSKGRRAALSLAIAVLIGSVGVTALNPDLITKFTDRGEIDPYNYQRVEIWRSTASMIAAEPVLGVGPARYEHVARRYRFPVEGTIGRFMKRASIAHSEYLHYSAEVGLPAAMLILGLLLYYIWLLFQGQRHGGNHNPLFLNTAGLLAAVGLSLHALVDNVFQVSAVTIVLLVVGLASSPLKNSGRVPFPVSKAGGLVAVLAILAVFLSSSLLPALAYELNDIGRRRAANGQTEEAIRAHRLAVAIRPNDAVLLTELGLAYKDLSIATGEVGTLDIAEAYLVRAAEANPEFLRPRQEHADTVVLRLSGESTSNRYTHRRLAIAYLKVLELDPFLPLVRHNLAEALYKSGERDEAYDQIKQTLVLEPNFVPGYLKLANWYASDGDRNESQRLRTEAALIARKYADQNILTDYESRLLGRPQSKP